MNAEEPLLAYNVRPTSVVHRNAKNDIRAYAKQICSEAEYAQLEQEGFLTAPTLPAEPQTHEELLAEVEAFHQGGYLDAEETKAWFKQLAS